MSRRHLSLHRYRGPGPCSHRRHPHLNLQVRWWDQTDLSCNRPPLNPVPHPLGRTPLRRPLQLDRCHHLNLHYPPCHLRRCPRFRLGHSDKRHRRHSRHHYHHRGPCCPLGHLSLNPPIRRGRWEIGRRHHQHHPHHHHHQRNPLVRRCPCHWVRRSCQVDPIRSRIPYHSTNHRRLCRCLWRRILHLRPCRLVRRCPISSQSHRPLR